MKRVRVFAKGNVDVRDSLHSCVIAGELQWNGVNEAVRRRHKNALIRLKHETWTRSDALIEASGAPPTDLAARALSLGAYPLVSQFSVSLFDFEADAFILSIQPDVSTSLFRHKSSGFLFYPSEISQWEEADRSWLKEAFIPVGQLSVGQSIENMEAIISKIQSRTTAPILIYNISSIVPGESVHCFQGLGETYSMRAGRFNLALTDLSARTGVSIVDVDGLLARRGAERLKLDAIHLVPEAYEMIAEEVVRILEDYGLFDSEDLA